MLKRMLKVTPVLIAVTLFTTGAVAETQKPDKCLANAKLLSTSTSLRTNTDPKCGEYYEKCEGGKCYECIECTYGGPYCWEISR